MASLKDVHIPASQALGLMMLAEASNELKMIKDKTDPDLYKAMRTLVGGVAPAIEGICDQGNFTLCNEGKALAILVTDNVIQAGCYALDSLMEQGFFDLKPAEATDAQVWSAVFDCLDAPEGSEDREKAGLAALLAVNKQAAQTWGEGVKKAQEGKLGGDVPILIMLASKRKDDEAKWRVGGVVLVVMFPLEMVNKMAAAVAQAGTVANAVADMQQDLGDLRQLN